jgi:hypothetical protein
LLINLLHELKAGKELRFGQAVIRDDAVTLPTQGFWGPGEEARYLWTQVNVWSASGAFWIGARENKKVYAAIEYLGMANVHVLENAIRAAFQKPGMRRLSDVLGGH